MDKGAAMAALAAASLLAGPGGLRLPGRQKRYEYLPLPPEQKRAAPRNRAERRRSKPKMRRMR